MPSFGGEVKPSVPCCALRHVKEHKSDVEVATFGKIFGHFSPIVPPSAARFASVNSDAGGLLWRKLEGSKSLVLLQVGGLTCRWQRNSVKPSCWECSKTFEQAETHLRVAVPIEEEEEWLPIVLLSETFLLAAFSEFSSTLWVSYCHSSTLGCLRDAAKSKPNVSYWFSGDFKTSHKEGVVYCSISQVS
jgi:hypothetical protein